VIFIQDFLLARYNFGLNWSVWSITLHKGQICFLSCLLNYWVYRVDQKVLKLNS